LEPAHCGKSPRKSAKVTSSEKPAKFRENSSKNLLKDASKPSKAGKLRLESKSTSAHSGFDSGNEQKYEHLVDNNRIMEDELKQASDLLDCGRAPSFCAENFTQTNAQTDHNERNAVNQHKFQNSTNSNRNTSSSHEKQELPNLRKSAYPTCKHENPVNVHHSGMHSKISF
jgi:hypothetical protein